MGFKHNFRNASWAIMIGLGSLFLLQREMPEIGLKEYIWPIAIIGAGLIFLLKPKRDKKWCRERWYDKHKQEYQSSGYTPFNPTPGPGAASEPFISSDDTFVIKSVFSGVQRRVLSKNFKGGKISCVFGGAEVDFMQADIQGTVELRMEEVFGGIKLLIPQSWTVRNEIDGVFHGVEDKRYSLGNPTTDENKILILRGSAVFAGVEIRSY